MLPEPPSPTRLCPHCDEPLRAGWDFCPECGHSVDASDPIEDRELAEGERHLPCPRCSVGELLPTSTAGSAQCDACGYIPRD